MLIRRTIVNAILKDRASSSSAALLKLPKLSGVLDALPILNEPSLKEIPEAQKLAASYIIDHQTNTYTHANTEFPQVLPKASEVLRDLGLNAIYSQEIIGNRVLIGFHGCSITSAEVVMHRIDAEQFGNQGSYHSNPDKNNHSFHVANTLRAALHYAKLNGFSQSSFRDPQFYDDAVIVMSCAPALPEGESYYSQKLQAWCNEKKRGKTLGRECLIPPEQFEGLVNYGLFRIKGPKRYQTLVDGQKIYHKNVPYLWSEGKLFALDKDVSHEFVDNRPIQEDKELSNRAPMDSGTNLS